MVWKPWRKEENPTVTLRGDEARIRDDEGEVIALAAQIDMLLPQIDAAAKHRDHERFEKLVEEFLKIEARLGRIYADTKQAIEHKENTEIRAIAAYVGHIIGEHKFDMLTHKQIKRLQDTLLKTLREAIRNIRRDRINEIRARKGRRARGRLWDRYYSKEGLARKIFGLAGQEYRLKMQEQDVLAHIESMNAKRAGLNRLDNQQKMAWREEFIAHLQELATIYGKELEALHEATFCLDLQTEYLIKDIAHVRTHAHMLGSPALEKRLGQVAQHLRARSSSDQRAFYRIQKHLEELRDQIKSGLSHEAARAPH